MTTLKSILQTCFAYITSLKKTCGNFEKSWHITSLRKTCNNFGELFANLVDLVWQLWQKSITYTARQNIDWTWSDKNKYYKWRKFLNRQKHVSKVVFVCFKTEFLKLLYTWNETPQVCFTGVQRDWDPVKLRFIDGTHQSIKQRIQTWWKYENSNMWQPCEGFFVQDIEHRAAKKLQVIRKQSKLMSRNLQHLQLGIYCGKALAPLA